MPDLDLVIEVALHLTNHFRRITFRSARTIGTDAGGFGFAFRRIFPLAIEMRELFVRNFVVRVRHRRERQQSAFAIRHDGAKGAIHNGKAFFSKSRRIHVRHFGNFMG